MFCQRKVKRIVLFVTSPKKKEKHYIILLYLILYKNYVMNIFFIHVLHEKLLNSTKRKKNNDFNFL